MTLLRWAYPLLGRSITLDPILLRRASVLPENYSPVAFVDVFHRVSPQTRCLHVADDTFLEGCELRFCVFSLTAITAARVRLVKIGLAEEAPLVICFAVEALVALWAPIICVWLQNSLHPRRNVNTHSEPVWPAESVQGLL